MKYLMVVLGLVLVGCSGPKQLADTCIPDTVRVYVNQVDTTFLWYANEYDKAFKFGLEQAQNDLAYIRHQSHQPDSIRAEYESRIAHQLLVYKATLAESVWKYFKKLKGE